MTSISPRSATLKRTVRDPLFIRTSVDEQYAAAYRGAVSRLG